MDIGLAGLSGPSSSYDRHTSPSPQAVLLYPQSACGADFTFDTLNNTIIGLGEAGLASGSLNATDQL